MLGNLDAGNWQNKKKIAWDSVSSVRDKSTFCEAYLNDACRPGEKVDLLLYSIGSFTTIQ